MNPVPVFSRIGFPEALRWHEGDLWFSDVLAGKVYRGDVDSGLLHVQASVQPQVSGIGWTNEGNLLAVNCERREVVEITSAGTATVYADLSEGWVFPANDMLVDPDTTIWIGTYGFNPEKDSPASATIGRVRDGVVDFPISGMIFANGISRIDENRIVIAETFADRISIVRTEGEVELIDRIQLPTGSTPDGLVVDNVGFAWVAMAYGEGILRVNLQTHEVAKVIDIQGRGVYDCTFGGPNLDKLYVAVSDTDETHVLRDLPGEILSFDLSAEYPGVHGMGNK